MKYYDKLMRLTKSKLLNMDKAKTLALVGLILAILTGCVTAVSAQALLLISLIATLLGIASVKCEGLGELVGNAGSIFFIWLGLGVYCGTIIGSILMIGMYISFYEAGKAAEERDRLSRLISEHENQKRYYKNPDKRPHQQKKKNRKYRKYND